MSGGNSDHSSADYSSPIYTPRGFGAQTPIGRITPAYLVVPAPAPAITVYQAPPIPVIRPLTPVYQGPNTVLAYYEEFLESPHYDVYTAQGPQTVMRAFLRGLQLELQRPMTAMTFWNLPDMMSFAMELELSQAQTRAIRRTSMTTTARSHEQRRPTVRNRRQRWIPTPIGSGRRGRGGSGSGSESPSNPGNF